MWEVVSLYNAPARFSQMSVNELGKVELVTIAIDA